MATCMSPRERVLAALRCEEPDRVPYCEIGIDRVVSNPLLGLPTPDALRDGNVEPEPFGAEEHKQIAAALKLDNICYELWPPVYAEKLKGQDGRLYYARGMIKSDADLAMVQLPDPYTDNLYTEAERFARNKGEYAACFVTRIGVFSAMLSMGIDGFCLSMYQDRNLAERLMDMYCDFTAVVAERVGRLGFDVFISTDDFAFNVAPFLSPAMFREVVIPRLRRVAQKINLPWIMHTDGNVLPYIDDLIELGIAGLHPIEKGAMDIRAVKRDYGAQICLLGNVDLNILGMGTPEDVEREVRELIRDIGPGGGYIVTSGNSLTNYVSLENTLALSEAVWKYGRYPLEPAIDLEGR
jgi:uroporphyrinogen decarboxylase